MSESQHEERALFLPYATKKKHSCLSFHQTKQNGSQDQGFTVTHYMCSHCVYDHTWLSFSTVIPGRWVYLCPQEGLTVWVCPPQRPPGSWCRTLEPACLVGGPKGPWGWGLGGVESSQVQSGGACLQAMICQADTLCARCQQVFDPAWTRLHRTFQSISHTTWFILHGIDIHTIHIPAKSGVWLNSPHCVQSYIQSCVYCLDIKAWTEWTSVKETRVQKCLKDSVATYSEMKRQGRQQKHSWWCEMRGKSLSFELWKHTLGLFWIPQSPSWWGNTVCLIAFTLPLLFKVG